MTSPLRKLLQGLSAPPIVTDPNYEGFEFKWRIFVFRPAELKTEAVILLVFLVYLLNWFLGKTANARRANKWLDAHLPILIQQFAKPGGPDLLISDGYSDFFNLSTGRRGVATLHTVFTLLPRHDLLQIIYQTGRSLIELDYVPKDEIYLDFLLSGSGSGFVWACVAKDQLRKIKKSRWDLTFTRATDHPQLPSSVSVMSEFADITENLFKQPNFVALTKLFSDPSIKPYFRSLSITDQPRERPTEGPIPVTERERHIILSLSASPPSQASITVPLVEALFSVVDGVDKLNLRPETRTKLKKIREDLDKELKLEAEKEKNDKADEDKEGKRTAKRKAEEERISRLSAAEQKKAMERDRKRTLRKQQGRLTKKA